MGQGAPLRPEGRAVRTPEHDLVVVAHPVVVDPTIVLSELEVGLGTHPVIAPDAHHIPLDAERRSGDGLRGLEAVSRHVALARAHGHGGESHEKEDTKGEKEPGEQSQEVLPVYEDIPINLRKCQ